MYIALRQAKVKSGTMDEVGRRIQQGFVSTLANIAGFDSYYVFGTDDDTVVTVSVFATKEEAEESNQSALGWIKQSLAELVVSAPQVTEGRVLVHAGK